MPHVSTDPKWINFWPDNIIFSSICLFSSVTINALLKYSWHANFSWGKEEVIMICSLQRCVSAIARVPNHASENVCWKRRIKRARGKTRFCHAAGKPTTTIPVTKCLEERNALALSSSLAQTEVNLCKLESQCSSESVVSLMNSKRVFGVSLSGISSNGQKESVCFFYLCFHNAAADGLCEHDMQHFQRFASHQAEACRAAAPLCCSLAEKEVTRREEAIRLKNKERFIER